MKKMMFNERYGLEQATIAGYKTFTTRIIPDKNGLYRDMNHCNFIEIKGNQIRIDFGNVVQRCWTLPSYLPLPGEIVAIAQSYGKIYNEMTSDVYVADSEESAKLYFSYILMDAHQSVFHDIKGWNNKMFVRANLMLHKIQFENCRVEKMQDITDEECLKEGIRLYTSGIPQCKTEVVDSNFDFIPPYGFDDYHHKHFCNFDNPREAFADLIDRISGKGTWKSNPFVLRYEYKKIC